MHLWQLNKWRKFYSGVECRQGLRTLAHELSHYYQWLNDLKLTPIGEERQATSYANAIIYEYEEEINSEWT